MNSIFLFDIDGTLSKDGIIPESAISTLKKLRAKGNIVMLATGRCLGQMEDVLSIIDIDGAILNNGALAYIGNEIIYESIIEANNIITMLNDGLDVTVLAMNDFIRFKEGNIYKDFLDVFNIELPRIENIDYLNKEKAYSLGVYSYDLNEINVNKYPNLRFVKVCDLGYDVINKDVTKASAIKYIKAKYPKYNIIAFGDNYNDIEMLDNADISIVMKKAPDKVKEYADYITKDVFEDGIEYAINEFLRGYYEAN